MYKNRIVLSMRNPGDFSFCKTSISGRWKVSNRLGDWVYLRSPTLRRSLIFGVMIEDVSPLIKQDQILSSSSCHAGDLNTRSFRRLLIKARSEEFEDV